jgi:site-specific recombinase XerD/REP element-mobilizing transposase RayT
MDSSDQETILLDCDNLATPVIRVDRSHLIHRPLGTGIVVPTLIADLGDDATKRFLEFFTANIRNKNTRAAYARAVGQFLAWCQDRGLALRQVEPMLVAAYIERLQQSKAKPTVKQHLAALRMLFDWLVTGHIIDSNPATSVRGPKHVVRKGKTHVLDADDARTLLDSIPLKIGPEPKPGEPDNRPPSLIGLRDRALIAVMVFSFARISAVLGMKVDDYYPNGKRWWLRLHEKGGKFHEVPAHHLVERYLDAYIQGRLGVRPNFKFLGLPFGIETCCNRRMPRRLRIQYPGAIYHLMARGNGRQDIVRDDSDRHRLEDFLGRAAVRCSWRVYAFALLSNHLHVVLKTPQPNLAQGMQMFLSSYANVWARRHRFSGHVFQGRYRTELVEDETYLWNVTRYVHLNPVRAGLVEQPAAWKWSSYRGYARRAYRLDWVAYKNCINLGMGRSVGRTRRPLTDGM